MKNEPLILLTGATGSLGSVLARRLLESTSCNLLLLARSRGAHTAEERVKKILERGGVLEKAAGRVRVVEGDVTQPRLGLSNGGYQDLVERTDVIYHAAALTSLNASWELCRTANVEGTERMLEFALLARRQGRLSRLNHFSTAYVGGSQKGTRLVEDDLPEAPPFANAYERSKHEAEGLVRAQMKAGLPVTIFRPSIVVGDSRTGEIPDFNVIYPFIRLMVHGFLRKIPARPEASCNIVPIDFVTEAALLISQMPEAIGKTFHLVTNNPPTVKTLMEIKDSYGNHLPIEVVPPEEFHVEDLSPEEALVFFRMQPYLGYLNHELVFDSTNTQRVLAKTSLKLPNTDFKFLRILFDHAIEVGYLLRPDDHGASI